MLITPAGSYRIASLEAMAYVKTSLVFVIEMGTQKIFTITFKNRKN